MTEKEMFEKSFQRPKNFFKLSAEEQWEIDKRLGILDWEGGNLTEEERKRFKDHYKDEFVSKEKKQSIEDAAKGVIKAWETLGVGHHPTSVIQTWLSKDMKIAIDKLREAFKNQKDE